MAVIYENQIKEELSRNNIKPVYLLFGDDGYLISHYENLIIGKTCGKDNDFDLMRFERNIDLQAVYDAVNQFPMMCDRKCVILSDFDFESAPTEDLDRLIKLVLEKYETSTLVLKFDAITVDHKNSAKAKKLIAAAEKSGGAAVCLNHRNETDIAKMLVNGAKKRGFTLPIDTARYMVQNCGNDINTLSRELEKLSFYVSGDVITAGDIDAVCIKSVDAKTYGYARKIILCDTLGALNDLNELFYMHIEPMLILYSAASVFVDMVRISAAKKAGIQKSTVAEDLGYQSKTFVLDNAEANLRRLNDKKLKLCMNEILSADKLLKSFSCDEKTVLEQMTVRLIYIIANGEAVD